MQTINITLNGKVTAVAPEITILEAARQQGIDLPTLCHHPDQRVKANCRICVVEIEGVKNLVPSCSTRVTAGMNITTNSPRVRETVRTILELIFADHPQECLTCIRNGNCELRQIAAKFGVRDIQGEKENTVSLRISQLPRWSEIRINASNVADARKPATIFRTLESSIVITAVRKSAFHRNTANSWLMSPVCCADSVLWFVR